MPPRASKFWPLAQVTHRASNGASSRSHLTGLSILSTKDSNSQALNRHYRIVSFRHHRSAGCRRRRDLLEDGWRGSIVGPGAVRSSARRPSCSTPTSHYRIVSFRHHRSAGCRRRRDLLENGWRGSIVGPGAVRSSARRPSCSTPTSLSSPTMCCHSSLREWRRVARRPLNLLLVPAQRVA
jgi:hypothetical protein